MKLSMWIFADRLKQYDPECHISFGKFSIETVRLFSDTEQSDASTLYVGRQKDFFRRAMISLSVKIRKTCSFLPQPI